MNATTTAQADRIVADARQLAGLSWAQFDFALIGGGVLEVGMAVGQHVTRVLGPVQVGCSDADLAARRALEAEAWAGVRTVLDARAEAARARGFVGWSSASTGPVRYADEA